MSRAVEAQKLAYRGVLIERPCAFCDTNSYHLDGLCQDGPCTVCGQRRRDQGWATHPLNAQGLWRGSYDEPVHDWQPHSYLPADIDQNLPAFEAMVDEARHLGMPEHYTSDLYRDYQFVRDNPDTRFIWIVRDMGTHIIVPATTGAIGAATYLRDNEQGARVYFWNGSRLTPANWGIVMTLLTRVYPTRVPA